MSRPNKNYEPKKKALAKLAFDLFVEEGYENVTISQIMTAAGLTKAGMYHYYDSKEEILDAAINYGIELDSKNIYKEMQNMSVEEKMLHFIKGVSEPNELMDKIIKVKNKKYDSYASYRIREKMIYSYIPIMEKILREGIEKGIYKCDYPQETAEFMILLAKAIIEPNMLPPAGPDRRISRMDAYLKLMEGWLKPTAGHTKDIIELIGEELNDLSKENQDETK